MKRLWVEFSTFHVHTECICNCICGTRESMFKVELDRRLIHRRFIQLLMGLNEVYIVVRGNIIVTNLLPYLAQTFSLLVEDKKKIEIKQSSQSVKESASLNASISGKKVIEFFCLQLFRWCKHL